MSGPTVFISHFTVNDAAAYSRMALEWVPKLEAEKPRTAVFLHYLDRETSRVTVVHVFADAEAMDLHFVGAEERGQEAFKTMTPTSWEIYGPASEDAVNTMRRAAEAAGVPLTVQSEYVAGFLRPGSS